MSTPLHTRGALSTLSMTPKRGVPPRPLHSPSLAGLRGVLSLAIVAFHVVFVAAYTLPTDEAAALWASLPLLRCCWLAVDGFLVLGGYLWVAGGAPGGEGYEARRAGRILPLLLCHVLLLAAKRALLSPPPLATVRNELLHELWALTGDGVSVPVDSFTPWSVGGLLLQATALVPFNGLAVHAWSVAVSYHAYLWLPWVWDRARLRGAPLSRFLSAAAGVVGCTLCARAVVHARFVTLAPAPVLHAGMNLFTYSTPLLRLHAVGLGALAAGAEDSSQGAVVLRGWEKRFPFALAALPGAALAALCAANVAFPWNWQTTPGPATAVYWAGVHPGSVGSALVWVCVVVGVARGWSGGWLRWWVWGAVSTVSYGLYLVHPTVLGVLFTNPALLFPPSGGASSAQPVPGTAGLPLLFTQARDWVAPPGHPPPPIPFLLFHGGIAAAASLLAAVALTRVENVGAQWMSNLTSPIAWYNTAVRWSLIAHVGVAALATRVTPEMEGWVRKMAGVGVED